MRPVIIALAVLVLIFSLTLANSIYIERRIDSYISAIDSDDGSPNFYTSLFEEFKRDEKFFSITISHSELFSVTDTFSELSALAESGKSDEIEPLKSRLKNALLHLLKTSELSPHGIL